jgi:hypothetical protein
MRRTGTVRSLLIIAIVLVMVGFAISASLMTPTP